MSMLITLLTDFGFSDVYVGVMKGTIAAINPHARIIDLTHQIPPQDLATARFQLMNAYPYFPEDTIHVAVVDPGVGATRKAIAIQLDRGILVGPDNGLFSGIVQQHKVKMVVELSDRSFWRSPNPSFTFHGRDIFAPVAAHLSLGVALQDLGPKLAPAELFESPIPEATRSDDRELEGTVQAIDHFGNVITTIPGEWVSGTAWEVLWDVLDKYPKDRIAFPGQQTYANVEPGETIGLIGSHGYIELAVNRGNAQQKLGCVVGDRICVRLKSCVLDD